MTTILYIVPYFGKFPRLFPVWLHSCANNPTVNWLILTDDKRDFAIRQMLKLNIQLLLLFESEFKNCLILR